MEHLSLEDTVLYVLLLHGTGIYIYIFIYVYSFKACSHINDFYAVWQSRDPFNSTLTSFTVKKKKKCYIVFVIFLMKCCGLFWLRYFFNDMGKSIGVEVFWDLMKYISSCIALWTTEKGLQVFVQIFFKYLVLWFDLAGTNQRLRYCSINGTLFCVLFIPLTGTPQVQLHVHEWLENPLIAKISVVN